MPSTIRLHRVLRAAPERVYRAFLDPEAMVKWFPPNGFTGKVHHLGRSRRRLLQDVVHELHHGQEPFLRRGVSRIGATRTICNTDKFDDPNLPGVMHVTITFKKVSCGTEVNITQEGVPDFIPAESCYLGWQNACPSGETGRGGIPDASK